MGGCCCSSRKPRFHGTPVYYYYPPDSEEHEALASHDGVATVLSSGLLIDLDMNMATPDTFRRPPTPIPYDVVLGRRQSTDVEPGEAAISCMDLKDCKNHPAYLPLSPTKAGLELMKPETFSVSAKDEEDSCPTCLEEYNTENPKIVTKCNHHFHLSCILEWIERSDTCPICDQEMIYKHM